jgi:hypothetical protein
MHHKEGEITNVWWLTSAKLEGDIIVGTVDRSVMMKYHTD